MCVLQAENQNRSYLVRSTASFSVIEMPYKNLPAELESNSTTVSLSVVWVSEPPRPVPAWVVALAVLAGLLLLALLIFIMYKVSRRRWFFFFFSTFTTFLTGPALLPSAGLLQASAPPAGGLHRKGAAATGGERKHRRLKHSPAGSQWY